MIKNIKTWSVFKMPLWLKWVLFIPIGYLVFKISTLFIYIALAFLFYHISNFQLWILLIVGIPILFPIFYLVSVCLWGSFYIGLSFSPNKTTTWLLAIWFIYTSFKGAIEMCTPVPEELGVVIIQLPCWAYILLQIYFAICLLIAVVVANINIDQDRENKEKVPGEQGKLF